MIRDTISNQILSHNKSIDFSEYIENTVFLKAFLETPLFEFELKALIGRYKQIHNKNISQVKPNEMEAAFSSCLPCLCFVPMEILNKNTYVLNIIQKGNLSAFFISLDDLQQRIFELQNFSSYCVFLPMFAYQVITTMKWLFMNELMTELGLGRETIVYQQTTLGKKKNTVVIKPMNKIQKSFNDNMRQINMKLSMGESIVGENQLGWLKVSDELRGFSKQPNAKEFILEDMIKDIGKVAQGLIPDALKQLDIYLLEKPSRSDTRRLYDQLFFFYQKMSPFDDKFESLAKRLEGLGNDDNLKAKETSLYYERLGRKMRRYFGIEFIDLT